MGDNFGMTPNNKHEKTAPERGYEIYASYNTKEEINQVINELHAAKIRAFKAHHKISYRLTGIESDMWYLWIKKEDLERVAQERMQK